MCVVLFYDGQTTYTPTFVRLEGCFRRDDKVHVQRVFPWLVSFLWKKVENSCPRPSCIIRSKFEQHVSSSCTYSNVLDDKSATVMLFQNRLWNTFESIGGLSNDCAFYSTGRSTLLRIRVLYNDV